MSSANETTFSELKLWDWFADDGVIGRKVADKSYAWRHNKKGTIIGGTTTENAASWIVTPLPTCTGFDWRPPGAMELAQAWMGDLEEFAAIASVSVEYTKLKLEEIIQAMEREVKQ